MRLHAACFLFLPDWPAAARRDDANYKNRGGAPNYLLPRRRLDTAHRLLTEHIWHKAYFYTSSSHHPYKCAPQRIYCRWHRSRYHTCHHPTGNPTELSQSGLGFLMPSIVSSYYYPDNAKTGRARRGLGTDRLPHRRPSIRNRLRYRKAKRWQGIRPRHLHGPSRREC